MTAITRNGPLPYTELKHKVRGPISEERLRELVTMASDRRILRSRTGDKDLPDRLWKKRPNRTKYVEIAQGGGYVVGVNVGRTYLAIGVADANGLLVSVEGDKPSRDLQGRKREEAWEPYFRGQIEVVDRAPGVIGRSVLRRRPNRSKTG